MARRLRHRGRPTLFNALLNPAAAGSAFLFIPVLVFVAVVVLVVMMRSNRLKPKIDRSLELTEESVRLAKEQVSLQTETNRLLARLIEAQARE